MRRVISELDNTWKEYLSFIDKFLPEKVKKLIKNKKIFKPLVFLAAIQLIVYSSVAIYYFTRGFYYG